MPTGYTSDVCERDVAFNEFVWTCARAFGALVMMRDNYLGATIPDRLPTSSGDYHVEALKKARQRLRTIKKMSHKVAGDRARRAYNAAIKEKKKHLKAVSIVRARLDAMREQVAAWTPPSKSHIELKDFMLKQLDETIRIDGTVSSYYTNIKKHSAKSWLKEALAYAERDIDYHTRQLSEARVRDAERQQWVDDLRANVPYTPSVSP